MYTKLSKLKRGKASGPDNLPSWILKDLWKEADVVPIPKSVAVKVFENDLRPISLTPSYQKLWNISWLSGLCHKLDIVSTRSRSDRLPVYLQPMHYYNFFTNYINLLIKPTGAYMSSFLISAKRYLIHDD